MYNLKIKTLKKPILLIIAISIWMIFPIFAQIVTINEKIETVSNSQETEIDQIQMQSQSFTKWKEIVTQADRDENGLNDNFEIRLKELSEVGYIEVNERNSDDKNSVDEFLGIQPGKTEIISVDDIPIIVSFPGENYDSSLFLFKELGGNVKSTYNMAINGFAGSINYDGLIRFSKILQQNKLPFLIEEDKIYQAQLYYAGRNMNLRPYVWDTLSYDGDEYSSIAVIDTGVDESHNFFSPGYSAGDFSYKIVGWRDEINALSTPYDDNGHGSHCSGIAAGIGGPSYDVSGRSVATDAYFFNYTGYDIPEQVFEANWSRFNVTDPGLIELFCEFDDFTPGPDDVDFSVYLYYGNTMVDSYVGTSDSWSHTLSYSATSGSLGLYSWRISLNLIDNTGDGYVSNFDIRFRAEIHWPFDPPQFGVGDPWKGVAPDAPLVGVKVLDEHGGGWSSDIINGINWVIANKLTYNITTISLSLGGGGGDVAFINAVNNAVENGIVTVVSAGNSGPGGNNIGSPGDADNVITVAAMSIDDEITDYSSQGGPSYTTETIKPDITAPGGSFNNLQMFSADTNDNDAETIYPTDVYANDMMGAQGTSMSAPAVAGASNLLIEAMGGHEDWGYTSTEAKRVKALLLMTATETYPLLRETYPTYSPVLNRGGKDVHEGYGRINVDVAIEAYTQELTLGSQLNAWITSSLIDPFNKHGLGCYVNLISGQNYIFSLDVPSGTDFDLHLYSENGTSKGEPIMVASSTSTGLGVDEAISYTATTTGKYYLVSKAISGEGNAIISYPILDHDLSVSLEIPSSPDLGGYYVVNTTVTNNGLNDEYDVDLLLYLDGIVVNSTTVPTLLIGASKTINYTWNPTTYKTYNFTSYAPPLPSETIISNNYLEEIVNIFPNMNYTMTEGAPYTWIDASGGTELSLMDDDSDAITLPFDFTFYNDTFSTIYLSSNGYLSFTDTDPHQFINVEFPSDDPTHYYMLAPFWDDLNPGGINVFVQSFGTYWVAEWLNIYHYGGSLVGSFEVILYETGEIVFNYDYLDYVAGGYTCGLNLGIDDKYYNEYLNLNSLTDDFALLFTPWWASLDHDLSVSLDTPLDFEIGQSSLINATVTNTGLNEEYDVDLILYLNGIVMNSTTISTLPVSTSEIITYLWIPQDYGTYNFTAYAPPIPSEPYLSNNIETKILAILDTTLFHGMFINYNWSIFGDVMNSDFTWSYVSGPIFHTDWYHDVYHDFWDVDAKTRVMSNSGGSGWYFGNGYHTPLWIFTNVSLGDQILIAVDAVGDHLFEVSSELIYDLPGFGLLELWELEDLTFPEGIVWYEKSTGILLNGTFFYDLGDIYNYTLDFLDTNVQFNYYTPPPITITTPDSTCSWETDTSQTITWSSTSSYDVKIELYKGGTFELEIIGSTHNDGSYSWNIPSHLDNGTDYQIKISYVGDPSTSDISEEFEIFSVPEIPDSITVTRPDSFAIWEMGTSEEITWTSTGSISAVKIELFKDGVLERIITASTTNDGSYTWSIPTDLEDGTDYQIKISDVSNSAVYDESPNFTITSAEGGGPPGIPSYNIYLVMVIIGVIGVVLLKKNAKLIK